MAQPVFSALPNRRTTQQLFLRIIPDLIQTEAH